MLKDNISIFRDKSSLIIRELLANPDKHWHVRELADAAGTSAGLVSHILNLLLTSGHIHFGGRGRNGFSSLKSRETLLTEWLKFYDFSLNKVTSFYLPSKNTLEEIVAFLRLKGIQHALTVHCGANLITNYFLYSETHLYIDTPDLEKVAIELGKRVELKKLIRGGNLHLIKPYYKNSIYHSMQTIKGFNIVSNIQLYLDLYCFMPRGREHADFLRETLQDKIYA